MNEFSRDDRTISLAGCSISWDDIDERIKKLHITRSKYVQNALEHYINRNKMGEMFGGINFALLIVILLGVLFL